MNAERIDENKKDIKRKTKGLKKRKKARFFFVYSIWPFNVKKDLKEKALEEWEVKEKRDYIKFKKADKEKKGLYKIQESR